MADRNVFFFSFFFLFSLLFLFHCFLSKHASVALGHLEKAQFVLADHNSKMRVENSF